MLENIKIVLVETSHSGNIGSAARAMKTMGLSELILVNPQKAIDEQSFALAAGADDVVLNAKIVTTFDEAIADCSLVIGTSARLRHLQNTLIEPRECGAKIAEHSQVGKVALVFGRERVGLSNEELLKCTYHLTIPANPKYSSLNLAMAVQLACYEIRQGWLALQKFPNKEEKENLFPQAQELEYFFQQTEFLYDELGFIQNKSVMPKLRHLYQKAQLEKGELNILLGMLKAVQKEIHKGR